MININREKLIPENDDLFRFDSTGIKKVLLPVFFRRPRSMVELRVEEREKLGEMLKKMAEAAPYYENIDLTISPNRADFINSSRNLIERAFEEELRNQQMVHEQIFLYVAGLGDNLIEGVDMPNERFERLIKIAEKAFHSRDWFWHFRLGS